MLRRSLATLGLITLVLGACHTNGQPANTMPDPMYPGMYYRASSSHQTRGNRSATRDAIASCTSATAIRSTPSGCSTAR
jgi:hypothetical protein